MWADYKTLRLPCSPDGLSDPGNLFDDAALCPVCGCYTIEADGSVVTCETDDCGYEVMH
jgi:hypothetical protein